MSISLLSCGGPDFEMDPVQKLKNQLDDKDKYTILLWDMDVRKDEGYHKYRIIECLSDTLILDSTSWKKVSQDFFNLHIHNLGMEVLSKTNEGKINNLPCPPGFTNIIGNELYGSWVNDSIIVTVALDTIASNGVDSLERDSLIKIPDGDFYWKFSHKFSYAPKMLGIDTLRISKEQHSAFINFHLFNRSYYGEKKETRTHHYYGSRGLFWRSSRPGYFARRREKNDFRMNSTSGGGSYSGGSRGGGGYGK